jgi:hypothetical protein
VAAAEASDRVAAAEGQAAANADAGVAVDAPGMSPSIPIPAGGVSATAGGYGGSRCDAVNAAISAISAASSPSSPHVSSHANLSPAGSVSGSTHGGRLFAFVFGHGSEADPQPGLCTASVGLAMVS